ncbi:hypothetical protein [Franconibacter pulveris]|uniref:hypothetical protein n=1 Tax=Franconibacter pulveris TaxID=435910 RepID=UPI0004985B01|nr:hypothetical protein [Franconibacter pulveris]
MSEQTDYRAIVERIAVILHGKVTDIDLLTVTVLAMKERNSRLERQRDEQPAPVVPDDVLEDAKILGAGFLKVLADGETHRLDPQKVIITFKNESGQPVASWWLNGDFSAEISRQTDTPPAPGKEG